MHKVKIYNNIECGEYAEDDYRLVYKTSVSSEGNRLDELFKKDNRIWKIVIPEEVIEKLETPDVRLELNKYFCKRYNGEQLVVKIEYEKNEINEYGFVIDSEENIISIRI